MYSKAGEGMVIHCSDYEIILLLVLVQVTVEK